MFDENYKPTAPRSSTNPKHKKHKLNCAKAYLNPIAETKE